MRRDDGDDAAGGEDEATSARLLNGIPRFFLDLSLIPKHERILPQAAADNTFEGFLRLGETRVSLAVMPVDDGKEERRKMGEVNVTSVEMENI